jgi:hypothetical protein
VNKSSGFDDFDDLMAALRVVARAVTEQRDQLAEYGNDAEAIQCLDYARDDIEKAEAQILIAGERLSDGSGAREATKQAVKKEVTGC